MRLTLHAIQAFLNQRQFHPELRQDTQQVSFILRYEQLELIFFVKPFPEQELLQLVVYLPVQYLDSALCGTARVLHRINCDLDRPGWCLFEKNNLIFYRTMIPCEKGECSDALFLGYIENLPPACHTFYPLIHAIAKGEKQFEELFP